MKIIIILYIYIKKKRWRKRNETRQSEAGTSSVDYAAGKILQRVIVIRKIVQTQTVEIIFKKDEENLENNKWSRGKIMTRVEMVPSRRSEIKKAFV